MYFVHPLKGFPLELGTSVGGQKTRMMELPGQERNPTLSSAVWTQSKVTDRRTPDNNKDCAYAWLRTVMRWCTFHVDPYYCLYLLYAVLVHLMQNKLHIIS